MSTLKETTMHPRCRHIGACWDLLEWFQLFSTSQNTNQIRFRTFLKKKKNQISWFSCCSTREDLSIDVSITYVGLIMTKPGRFRLDRIQFRQFRTFWKKFTFLGFHGVVATREDLSITNVGLILTKLWWLLFSGCGQTDRQTGFWNPHMETCQHTKNFNSKLNIRG